MMQNRYWALLVVSLFSVSVWAQSESNIGTSQTSFRSKSPWAFSFFQFARANREVVATGEARLETYNYFGGNYQLNANQKLAIRPAFLYNTAGVNSFKDHFGQEVVLSDLHVNFAQYNLASVLGFAPTLNFKLYVPTSNTSKEATMITRLGGHFIFDQALPETKFKITYNVKPDYYVVREPTYTKTIHTNPPNRPAKVLRKSTQNKQAGIDQYVEVGYVVNRDFTVKTMVGFKDDWIYGNSSLKRAPIRNESFKWGPSIEYRVTRDVSVMGGMENSWSVIRPNRKAGILRGAETDYFVLTSVRM